MKNLIKLYINKQQDFTGDNACFVGKSAQNATKKWQAYKL